MPQYIYVIQVRFMMKIKDLFGGEIVGTGSDFIVVLKGKNRLLLQFSSHNIIKLKKEATPYGSSV
jgi:hypothetical protein